MYLLCSTMSCKEYRIKKARQKEKLNTYMISLRSMTAKLQRCLWTPLWGCTAVKVCLVRRTFFFTWKVHCWFRWIKKRQKKCEWKVVVSETEISVYPCEKNRISEERTKWKCVTVLHKEKKSCKTSTGKIQKESRFGLGGWLWVSS